MRFLRQLIDYYVSQILEKMDDRRTKKRTAFTLAEESDNYDDIIKDLFLNSAFFREKSERKEQHK